MRCVKYAKTRVFLILLFPYNDKVVDSVIICENTGKKNTVFSNNVFYAVIT